MISSQPKKCRYTILAYIISLQAMVLILIQQSACTDRTEYSEPDLTNVSVLRRRPSHNHIYTSTPPCSLDYCNCMEWPIMSWEESSRCRMLQHASSPELDVVTTLRRCYVNYTGFLFGGEGSSNSHVWCARHCAVKCLSTWLMTSISSPKVLLW